MDPLRFRMATRDDSSCIIALLNSTFKTPLDVATWEWYVYGNPLGHSQVYLASPPDTDEIAGVIAFAPIRLRIGGETLACDFAHHLALKPEYRDTLSYISVLRHSLGAQASRGAKLAIGPPNRTAYPIHKTLMKWKDFGYLECLRKLSPAPRPHRAIPIDCFPGAFDEFFRRVSEGMAFCVEKDAAWVNWRFCRRPGSVYMVFAVSEPGAMSGYVVLKRWQEPDGYRKAHIVDLHAADDGVLAQLIAAAESYAAGCDELNLWAVQGYMYRAALEAMGFDVAFRQPLIVRNYDGSPISYPEGRSSFTYGDSDTVY